MAIVLEEQEHQKPLQKIFAEICPLWHARFQKKKLTTKEKFALGFEGAMCAVGEAHQWSGNYAFRRRRKYCQNCVRYSSMFPYAYNRKIGSDGYGEPNPNLLDHVIHDFEVHWNTKHCMLPED